MSIQEVEMQLLMAVKMKRLLSNTFMVLRLEC